MTLRTSRRLSSGVECWYMPDETTSVSAPASTSRLAFSAFTPPSTVIVAADPILSIIARRSATFTYVYSSIFWPGKPGAYPITRTFSMHGNNGSTAATGVSGLIDTPGFRRLAVRGIDPVTLGACFPEIRAASAGCALGSRCKHLDEPGCAVVAALETGEVHEDRYESYARILAELEDTRGYAKKAGRPRRHHEDDYEDA